LVAIEIFGDCLCEIYLRYLVASDLLNWKYICKKAIKLFWTENLQKMLQDKTSLRNVNTKDLKVGSTHLVWTYSSILYQNQTDIQMLYNPELVLLMIALN
jgi:hypothetical protein